MSGSGNGLEANSGKRVKTGGRQKGVKNRRTVEVEQWLRPLLPGAKRKLKELLASGDDSIALKASLAVIAYIFGRPLNRQELTGADGEGLPLARIERVIVDSRPPERRDPPPLPAANGAGRIEDD